MIRGKTASTVELSDCGKTIRLYNPGYGYNFDAEVQMVIKAPRGTLVLYKNPYRSKNYWRIQGTQCQAIRAFVEAHKYGQAVCF